MPEALHHALCIRIGKAGLGNFYLDVVALDLPLQLCLQLLEGDGGFFKNTGKVQHTIAHTQGRFSPSVAELEGRIQAFEARNPWAFCGSLWLQRQCCHLSVDLICAGCQPFELQLVQGAVWLPARGSLADKGRDRQGLHHITGHRKIGLLQFKLGAVGRRDAAHRADRPAAAWPGPTVGSAKAQVLGLHTPAVWLPAAFQAPLQLLQFQGRNVWIQPVHACMAQRQVGGDAYGLPIFHIQPGTHVAHAIQCLYAPGLGPGQGGDLLQLQAGIPLATPSFPGG